MHGGEADAPLGAVVNCVPFDDGGLDSLRAEGLLHRPSLFGGAGNDADGAERRAAVVQIQKVAGQVVVLLLPGDEVPQYRLGAAGQRPDALVVVGAPVEIVNVAPEQ